MQGAKGIAVGFVAGLAVAGGAALLLRDDTSRTREAERIAELGAQIQRLESAVSKLSGGVTAAARSAAMPSTVSRDGAPPLTTATSREAIARDADQVHAVAEADALVDRGLQSGQWTREQAADLNEATANLSVEEQGRILARVSAAINEGQLQVELP